MFLGQWLRSFVTTRCAFISRRGSVAYVAVTYDESGGNLPREIDGNKVEWTRIETSQGEVFSLLSTADMERDLHEVGAHITETRAKPRSGSGHRAGLTTVSGR